MAVKKDKYTSVVLRVSRVAAARLLARCRGEKTLYALAKEIIEKFADGSLLSSSLSVEEYTELDCLARRIGFSALDEMARYLLLAYLKMYKLHASQACDDVVREELREMFDEMNVLDKRESSVIVSSPRKLR